MTDYNLAIGDMAMSEASDFHHCIVIGHGLQVHYNRTLVIGSQKDYIYSRMVNDKPQVIVIGDWDKAVEAAIETIATMVTRYGMK